MENSEVCCTPDWYFRKYRIAFVHTSVINNTAMFVFRVIFALYFLGNFIFLFTQNKNPMDRIKYLTNFGYFFTSLYFIVVVQDRIMGHKYNETMRYWVSVLFQTAFTAEGIITIIYWIILFQGFTEDNKEKYMDISVHALPLAFLIIDFIFCSYNFDFRDYLITFIILIIYLLINLAMTLGVKPIYPVLSWKDGPTYGYVIAAIAISLVFYGAGTLLYTCVKKKKLDEMIGQNSQDIHERDRPNVQLTKENGGSVKIQPQTLNHIKD